MAAPLALINNGGYPLIMVGATFFLQYSAATNNPPLYGRIQLSYLKITWPSYEIVFG
jgi:hypothetical protein